MFPDGTVRRRQTNWKYVMILVVLALGAMVMAWSMEHPWNVKKLLPARELLLDGSWTPAEVSAHTQLFSLEDGLAVNQGNQICVLNGALVEVYDRESAGDMVVSSGGFCAAFTPQSRELFLLEQSGSRTLELSGGVDAVFVGENHISAVTAAPGCISKILLFHRDGTRVGEISYRDEAVAFGGFFPGDTGFWSLSFCTDGLWRFGCYGLTGEEVRRISLETDVILGAVTFGEHVVLRTRDGLVFLDPHGNEIHSVSFGTWEFVLWNTDKILTAALCSRGQYKIITLSGDGTQIWEAIAPLPVRDLEVLGERVLVLDQENILVYDGLGNPETVSTLGARTASMVSGNGTLWLLGSGEIMKLKS